jgi:hypothetical protein
MSLRIKRALSAIKHGAYSTNLLPGESTVEFEELHRQLIAEWNPNGAYEMAEIANLAHLLWRRQNLGVFRLAEFAQRRTRQIQDEVFSNMDATVSDQPQSSDSEKVATNNWGLAEAKARNELGELYPLVEAGEQATYENLKKELEILERLDARISRSVKNLLLARGAKSICRASISDDATEIPASKVACKTITSNI